MFVGVLCLAGHWTSEREATGGLLFLGLGLVVPMASWALGFAIPPALLALPVSLAVLAALLERERRQGEGWAKSQADAELAAANARLEADPGDGAALELRARILERKGAYLAALDDYDAAHRASDRSLPEPELRQIRERLKALAAEEGTGRAESPELGWAWLEAGFLGAGLLCVPAEPLRGAALASIFAFLLWLRRHQRLLRRA